MAYRLKYFSAAVFAVLAGFFCAGVSAVHAAPDADIVFVTQVPIPSDFANVVATFGNQYPSLSNVPRGGDLYIRYKDGTLKNITQAAGYGQTGLQAGSSIAVRDPAVHWNGNKVLFSMVVGGATRQYEVNTYYWQLYEVTGLGKNDTPVITKVKNQPSTYNNIMAVYGTDDRIIFSTDRPINGQSHLYPQRDEYESTPTNTGLWSLDPESGDLILLDHAPSGAFHPIIDSYGRVIYTRWDHLQRDQQAGGLTTYGAFNFSDEASDATRINSQAEVFPEARNENERTQSNLNLHTFNHFFPWMIAQDGTGHETLNHIGRHELHSYFDKSFNDDDNLSEFFFANNRLNKDSIQNFFQIREDPRTPGLFYGIDAPEFGTHASGQIVSLSGAPTLNADQMALTYVTHRDTASYTASPSANHSGLYRNPLPLNDGTLVASHTSETRQDANAGTSSAPRSRYALRLKSLRKVGSYYIPDQALTSGINKSITYWDPDSMLSYSGELWELQPVELRARVKPDPNIPGLEDPEKQIFDQTGVTVAELKNYLRLNDLAVIVGRNVTTRDANDIQQPFNLRITGTSTQTVGASGKIYDTDSLQIFQGDLIRGYNSNGSDWAGRRVLAKVLHDGLDLNVPNPSGPEGSVALGSDGSFAAFVPARRALTWQLTGDGGEGIIRERYWLTFQPGEIRVCTSCHGLNTASQSGGGVPTNAPEALRLLLEKFKGLPHDSLPVGRFKIELRSGGKKPVAVKKLASKAAANIRVRGLSGNTGSQNMSLRLSANGKNCPSAIKNFATNDDGIYSVYGKIPKIAETIKLKFTLHNDDGKLTESGLTLLPPGSEATRTKKLSAKSLNKLCAAFKEFRPK